ncbi:MAG TPA: hypothetical protein VGG51_13845 [Candidatus Cybelea sp.]|jgi:hypothetical protein
MIDDFQKYTGYTKTLELVSLFLERRGYSFVGVPTQHSYHKNFIATDGVASVIVSIYNTGALDVPGSSGGRLRTILESFRSIVGPKPKGAK